MGTGFRRRALIGFVGGLLAGPLMLLWLFVYSALRPGRPLGSTAVLGPFMGWVQSTLLGVLLGAFAGAVVARFVVQLDGLRRLVVFGAVLMGIIGVLMVIEDYFSSPDRFAAWTMMIVGMDVAGPILAGMAAGASIAWLSRTSGTTTPSAQ